MAERGNIQLRGYTTSLIGRAGQYITGLPPTSGTTEGAFPFSVTIEGCDLPSDLPITIAPQYISTVRDAPVDTSAPLVNQPYGYIGQGYVQPINIAGGGGATTVTYYKMRGYYVAGSVWETWVSTGSPGSPPSGHTLIDTVIVSKWVV